MLSTDYRIPELNHLKDFLKYLSSNKNTNFSEINTYSKGVFILSLVFGFTVEDLILFLHNEHQSIKQLKKGKISSAIDPELFSKYKVNTLLKKTGFTINYVLQDDLYKLMNKLTKYMPEYSNLYYYLKNIKWETSCKVHLLEISNQNIRLIVNLKILERFSSFKEDYFKSMGKIINEYDKKIIIDLNNIWKITLRLSKVFFGDDTIAMLSIAKYQRNDTAKLSYSSTQNFSQKHSLFVEKISTSLDLPNVISKLLNIKYEPSSHSFSTIESNYVGSHRALNHNISRDFFGKMYDLIIQEENKYKKFNLISIYIRYAMSILCGTRDSKNSSSIENISFLMHTQMITEKSDSKLSGIRIIPLCIKIENLIKYYNETSEKLNIKLNYISLYDNNNFIKFNKKSAFKIIENISSDKKLQNFINFIPVNVGRHIITQYKIEKKFNATYIATFLGHYGSGEEQLGIYSPLNLPQYIHYIRENMENIANLYGIKEL